MYINCVEWSINKDLTNIWNMDLSIIVTAWIQRNIWLSQRARTHQTGESERKQPPEAPTHKRTQHSTTRQSFETVKWTELSRNEASVTESLHKETFTTSFMLLAACCRCCYCSSKHWDVNEAVGDPGDFPDQGNGKVAVLLWTGNVREVWPIVLMLPQVAAFWWLHTRLQVGLLEPQLIMEENLMNVCMFVNMNITEKTTTAQIPIILQLQW